MKVFVFVVVLALIAIGVEASETEFTSECTYEKYRNNECMIVLRSEAEPRYVNSAKLNKFYPSNKSFIHLHFPLRAASTALYAVFQLEHLSETLRSFSTCLRIFESCDDTSE